LSLNSQSAAERRAENERLMERLRAVGYVTHDASVRITGLETALASLVEAVRELQAAENTNFPASPEVETALRMGEKYLGR
jgi:hypothetical protein